MYRAILFAVSLLVPAGQREAWLAEWVAELCYVRRHAQRAGVRGCEMRFCLGSLRDAYWLRKDDPDEDMLRLKSPGWCLALLASVAIACLAVVVMTEAGRNLLFLSHRSGICYGAECLPVTKAREVAIQFPFGAVVCSCVILPVTTGISLGRIGSAPGWYRRWLFLAGKVALVLLIMCAISLGAWQFRSMGALMLLSNTVVFGGIGAFRWVLLDQRGRCPVCLQLLDNPIDVGQASRCLIDSECTELVCLRGHGFLHVPGVTVSWRGTQTWHYMDASWSGLFSQQ